MTNNDYHFCMQRTTMILQHVQRNEYTTEHRLQYRHCFVLANEFLGSSIIMVSLGVDSRMNFLFGTIRKVNISCVLPPAGVLRCVVGVDIFRIGCACNNKCFFGQGEGYGINKRYTDMYIGRAMVIFNLGNNYRNVGQVQK